MKADSTMRRGRALVCFFMLFLSAFNVLGYFSSSTPLPKLARHSDYLVVGKVIRLDPDVATQRVRVTLEILESFKGDALVGGELVFEAPFSLRTDIFGGDLWETTGVEIANRIVRTPMLSLAGSTNANELVQEIRVTNQILRSLGHRKPSSFASNEICAVFLKKSKGATSIVMTMESDGKYKVDWEKRLFSNALTGANPSNSLDALKLEKLQPHVVHVGGAVRAPGQFPWTKGMTVSNAIVLAGGITNGTGQTYLQVHYPDEPFAGGNKRDEALDPGATIMVESARKVSMSAPPVFVWSFELGLQVAALLILLGLVIFGTIQTMLGSKNA